MTENPAQAVPLLQLLLMLSVISLAPSLLIMLTSFTRLIISLQFLRSALGTQQMPPNQVLIGLALFLTMFLMGPIFTDINENAIKPFSEGRMSAEQAIDRGMAPLREFMRAQAEDKDIALFAELSGQTFETPEDIPDRALIPAFMLGELTKGFKVGFIIYLPFIVIDMIVASVLMAMGMMMLPPVMISLPFKILLFIMSGGWSFMIESLVRTFRM
ncbi:MAG: flagellar type III secretion system pore protein FliP [Clostridiales bacterium]|jgi:flagellar biosynthetic protein FliP|nr:flagellar type III secretion system pore protein FliP [Clostridiales bacterium]